MNYQNNKNKSVAIIGAGLSGLSCATHLKALGYQVELFEKSRGPSGRMSTRHGDGWTADHGAQYFTARDPHFIQELDSWISQSAAAVWSPDVKVYEDSHWRESHSKENRYVGTPDMSSPGKYLSIIYQCNLIKRLIQSGKRMESGYCIVKSPANSLNNLMF